MAGPGRPRVEDLFTATELAGGKERSLLAAEYAEKKAETEEEGRLKELAAKFGVQLEGFDEPEDKGELKKLSVKHKFILALYMTGRFTQVEIANQADCHYMTVHTVLNSKLGQQVINDWQQMMELELNGLMPLAVGAIRSGLKSGDKRIQLSAVDRFIKMTGTEEGGTNVTVNVVNEARTRFITDIKELAVQENILEGAFKEVPEEVPADD